MIIGNGNNVVSVQGAARTTPLVIMVATFLASVMVALKDAFGETLPFGSVVEAPPAALPISMIHTGLYPIPVLVFGLALVPWDLPLLGCKPAFTVFLIVALLFNDMAPVIVWSMTWLKPHARKRWATFFCESLVPHWALQSFACTRVVRSFKPRNVKGCSLFAGELKIFFRVVFGVFVAVNRKRFKLFTATALANNFNLGFTLSLRRHITSFFKCYTVHYTRKVEGSKRKPGELLGTPNVKARAISSRAAMGDFGIAEGSTTMAVSPNNNPPHEHPARKGRYSLNCMETCRAMV